ncbi:hypothetical protein FPV67DRAFT_1394226, partial [Lyophyllum atratum]
ARIPILFYEQNFTAKKICELLGIKKSLVYSSLLYFKACGVAHNPHVHRKTGTTDIKLISALITRRHTIYLDEIQDELYQHRGICVSVPTLCKTLHCLDTRKVVVSACALEQNHLIRSDYMNRIAEEVGMMMFIDGAARNQRSSQRPKGWASLGKRCIQKR